MNITKLELCNRVSKRLELQGKKFSANCLETVFESFMDEVFTVMAEGKNLELRGFGSFKPKDRKERIGRNPRTGLLVNIPQYKAPTFKFSKDGQKIFDKKVSQALPEKTAKKIFTTKEIPVPAPVPKGPVKTIPGCVFDNVALKTAENFRA